MRDRDNLEDIYSLYFNIQSYRNLESSEYQIILFYLDSLPQLKPI